MPPNDHELPKTRMSAFILACYGLKTCLAVCLAFLTVDCSGGQEISSYSVEEIVAGVTDKLTSIASLDCEYLIQYGDSAPVRCRSARSGAMWRYEELTTGQQDQKAERIYCCDDNIVYACTLRHQRGKEKWALVELQDRRAQENHDPDELLGVRLCNISRSLAEVFELGAPKPEKRLADETNRVGLLAKAVPSQTRGSEKLKYDVTVKIDPARDFLPQELTITESADNITWPGWEQRWKILDFRQVLDERTNRQRWFPVLGILSQGKTKAPTIKMQVDKVRINPTLPLTMFRPQIPDGTTVSDVTRDGSGKIVIKGGHIAISNRIKDLTEQAPRFARTSRPGDGLFSLPSRFRF
jgi:hypothetical protein